MFTFHQISSHLKIIKDIKIMLTNQIKIIRIRHITNKYTIKLDLNSKASLMKIIIKIIQHKTHKHKHKIKIKLNLNVIVI